MTCNYRLLFGPFAAALFGVGVVALAAMVPGYDFVHQTVSEIGEVGSPARIPFAVMLCCVAICLLIFASGVRTVCAASGRSQWTTYLIAFMAIPSAGIGIFAFPHPLHNVFGLSELIGYQAPFCLALTWRHDPRAKSMVTFSWIMWVVIWLALGLNMSPMYRQGIVWTYVKPVLGLAQRSLFAAWFVWAALIGLMLYRSKWRNEAVSTPYNAA